MVAGEDRLRHEVLTRLAGLRLNQHRGRRAPHKPMPVLLALGRLANDGPSELPWPEAQSQLSALIAEFGPASKTKPVQSAAHVRWFALDGPDTVDNGLALCVLRHKLFDLGALGLDDSLRIDVSAVFSARTTAGRALYDLHGRTLRPRPGTVVPAPEHIWWHRREVFKGEPLAA